MKKIFGILIIVLVLIVGYKLLQRPMPSNPSNDSRLNIDEICDNALAYMSFPDGAAADRFLAECKRGEHPDVIERYKAESGVNDEAVI